MSERRYLACDSCGARLYLPTTPQIAATWQRLSIGVGQPFKHVCGQCDHTKLLEKMEETRGE